MLGRVLGHYELVARLGAGGMGAVYRGVHQTLQQPRAVKILRPDLANEPDVVARFRREAMIAASLRHPHIVLIYDVAEDQDIHYIVMDLLVGGSLRDVIRSSAPLPFARAMHLLGQLASSLDYAHGRGVIHRDIKPGNVMVSADDEVTLVDFGIARAADEARLTRSGTVVGTAEYMAPESFTSEGSEKSSDLYALGIIAYELLTGHAPFRGNPTAVSYAQVNTPPPPARTFFADVPEAVEAVLLKQLAKGPAERFPDATSFVEALKAAGEGAARDNVPTTAFDRPTIAPLPPLPQAPTALQTPLPGSSPPGQAPPSGAPPGTPSSTPAPTIMQSPPGVQRPATPHQGTSPPVGPPPTVVQPSQSGTPVPPGPYGPQQQSTPLPPRGYIPPPQSTPQPPGARPGAPYPAAPPDRSSTIRVVVFSLVVLAVVLLGSIAIWFMTSAPSEVASATP
ncbi:MAG: protein kinase, partial [Chloroflexota bacterium]